MSKFESKFAPVISAMLEYRVVLGLSADTLEANLRRFDRYCVEQHSENLNKDLVFSWLAVCSEKDSGGVSGDASAMRHLARYLDAAGQEAYVLPDGFYPFKSTFSPYIFTDAELMVLFRAIDSLPAIGKSTEFMMAPVLFRLIYTCGLRPNEGRELLCRNIDLDTGEVQIVNTKKKKDRMIVMSDDMLMLCRSYSGRRNNRDSEYFFSRADGEAYTAAQIDRLFKRCWANANPGIADLPNVRTYDLRHRFASARLNRWLDEGCDLNVMLPYLRAHMGHNSLNETAYYVHILPDNLVKSAGIDWDALGQLLPEVDVWQS